MKMELGEVLAVAIGGGVGAVCRYTLTCWQPTMRLTWATLGDWPWGTLVVNLLGCLLIGCFMGSAGPETVARWRLVFVVGFLGSFTTFSALAWESWQGWQQNEWSASLCLLALHLVLGFALLHLGYISAQWLKS